MLRRRIRTFVLFGLFVLASCSLRFLFLGQLTMLASGQQFMMEVFNEDSRLVTIPATNISIVHQSTASSNSKLVNIQHESVTHGRSTHINIKPSVYEIRNQVLTLDYVKSRIVKLRNKTETLNNPCANPPPGLVGSMAINFTAAASFNDHKQFNDVQPGGIWRPSTCVARQRTAIIIPFRAREKHLQILLYYLIPVLKRQQIDFQLFLVEQHGNKTFNKGRIMNAGFIEAWANGDFDCFVFHDVDLIPENDKNMYTCEGSPRHMSSAVDKFRYKLPYTLLVGGVFSIRPELYMRVNGYSNLYWGWGAEDDDMAFRLKHSRLNIVRSPAKIGRFKMVKHEEREKSPAKIRFYLLKTVALRYHKDGLNTLDYKIVFTKKSKLYTHVMVDIGDPPKDAYKISNLMT